MLKMFVSKNAALSVFTRHNTENCIFILFYFFPLFMRSHTSNLPLLPCLKIFFIKTPEDDQFLIETCSFSKE